MLLQLNWNDIADLLINANDTIVLCMPSIHEEWIMAIERNAKRSKLKVKVCIENSETVVRNGYGSITSIDKLKKLEAEIKQCEGVRINYLRVDDEPYLIFLESRIIAGDPKGLNAFHINDKQFMSIEDHFFPTEQVETKSDISLAKETFTVKPLDEIQLTIVKAKLEANPPVEPDLKRQISVYSNFFQFADIHFEGANLQSKTITIPEEAFPFTSIEFKKRLKTNYILFSKEDAEKWTVLLDCKQKVENLRKTFLKSCSLRKNRNILRKNDKPLFVKDFEAIKTFQETKFKDMSHALEKSIENAKSQVCEQLKNTINQSPPEEISRIKDADKKEKAIQKIINNIIKKTKFPTVESILSGFSIEVIYADLTAEDIEDPKLIDWFIEKELIDKEADIQISSFQKAYVVRK